MEKIGLQLYTVKDQTEKDFLGTVRKVDAMGYDGVEFAGYFDTPANVLRDVLDEAGLEIAGTHIGVDGLKNDLENVVNYAKAIGCTNITCPGFWGVDLKSEKTFHDFADFFNKIGEQLRKEGFFFQYHIHGHEFEKFGSQNGMEIIISETLPENFSLQLDTYWVESAGLDCLEFLQKYGNRTGSLHMKDMQDKKTMKDVEVGNGALDVPALVETARKFDIPWLTVEQEQFDRPTMESVEISLRNLRCIIGVEQ